MELVIEVGLLCGASVGITYERLQKHTVFIDFVFLRLVVAYGPETPEAAI
jgi:hypothetical protein